MMKVGDLVKKQNRFGGKTFDYVGLIIEEDNTTPFPNDTHYKVMWSGDYGTFWTPEKKLEVKSNA